MNRYMQFPLEVPYLFGKNLQLKYLRFHEFAANDRKRLPVLVLFDEYAMSLKNPD
ncbi:MAG: hypothetical protein ACLPY1_21965 [Terracidiphilus sp.]